MSARLVAVVAFVIAGAACGPSMPSCDACASMTAELRPRDCDRCDPSEMDSDGDGITDDRDLCPSQPETYNGYQDWDGCPDTAPSPPPSPPTDGGTSTPRLDVRMGGWWSANARSGSAVFPARLVIQTEGGIEPAALISGLCPDGKGTIVVSGNGSTGTSSSSLVCESMTSATCASVRVTMRSITVAYNSQANTMHIEATGDWTGCGLTDGASATFDGVR